MKHLQSVAVTSQATFGRDSAMFESLLSFVAQLSLVLWGLVTVTAVIRFVGIRIYRRGAARAARAARAAGAEAGAPGAVAPAAPRRGRVEAVVPGAVVPSTVAAIDPVQPVSGQLIDAGPVRLGLFGSTVSGKDDVLAPAELVDGKLVDARTTDAGTNAAYDGVLQPTEAPAAVATSLTLPRRAIHRRRESRSATHVPALAANSTET